MAQKILLIAGLAFLVFGVLFLAIPERMMRLVEIPLDTPTAVTEIRAFYGGLEIGLGAFLIWCCIARERVRTGLWAAALTLAGLAFGRSVGIAAEQGALSAQVLQGVIAVTHAGLGLDMNGLLRLGDYE